MNLINKSFLTIFVILIISFILPINISNGSDLVDEVKEMNNGTLSHGTEVTKIRAVARNILRAIQLFTGLSAIIIIAYTGLKMVTEDTPESKNAVKKSMTPIITGILIAFSAITIAAFITRIFEK